MSTQVTRKLIQLPIIGNLECPGDMPGGVAWDGADFWVLDEAAATLYRIDRETGGVHAEAPADSAGGGATFDGTVLYQASPSRYRILVIDPATGRTIRQIPTRVRASGLAWDGSHLWHGSFSEKRTYMLDADLGEVRGTIDSPVAGGGLAWDGAHFWCCDAGALFKVDTDGSVIGAFAIDGTPRQLAFDGKALWFSCARDRQLKRVMLEK